MIGEKIMKKIISIVCFLFCVWCIISIFCSSSLDENIWIAKQDFYKINQRQVGNYQDSKEDWENSTIFRDIFIQLEDKYNAFICSTWNYDIINGKPRYETTKHGEIPIEYDYYGYSLTISKNYFKYTSIKDVNGNDIRRTTY